MPVKAAIVISLFFVGGVAAAEPSDRTVDVDAKSQLLTGAGLRTDVPVAGIDSGVGWDSFDAAVTDRLHVVAGANKDLTWRPFAGARLAVAPGAAVTFVYKSEGFTEPEGEIEVGGTLGHAIGPGYVLANARYGQDVD